MFFAISGVFLLGACKSAPVTVEEVFPQALPPVPAAPEIKNTGWVQGVLVLPPQAVLKDDVWAQIELLELRDRLPPRVVTTFMIEKPRSLPISFVFKVPDGLLTSTKEYRLVAVVYQGSRAVWTHKEEHRLLLDQPNRIVLTAL